MRRREPWKEEGGGIPVRMFLGGSDAKEDRWNEVERVTHEGEIINVKKVKVSICDALISYLRCKASQISVVPTSSGYFVFGCCRCCPSSSSSFLLSVLNCSRLFWDCCLIFC